MRTHCLDVRAAEDICKGAAANALAPVDSEPPGNEVGVPCYRHVESGEMHHHEVRQD